MVLLRLHLKAEIMLKIFGIFLFSEFQSNYNSFLILTHFCIFKYLSDTVS